MFPSAEFVEIKNKLLTGEMSHADLNNWFFDFYDRNINETDSREKKTELKTESESKLEIALNSGIIFNCNKNGEFSIGAITFVQQITFNLILSKLKNGFALFKSSEGWYTISNENLDNFKGISRISNDPHQTIRKNSITG